MPLNVKTPSGKVIRVNANNRRDAIREIFAAGLAEDAGFISSEDTSPGFTGTVDEFLVGAGRTFNQAYNTLTGNVEREREQARQFELSSGQQGLASTLGRAAPALATLPISGGLGTQAAVGAGIGALGSPENPALGAAAGTLGAGIGYGAGQALNRIPGVARFGNDVSEQIQAAIDRTRRFGVRLRPSQRNPQLARQEALLESNLGSRAVFETLDETQQKTLNRLAAESIGEPGDDLSLVTLERARKRIGNMFKEALGDNDVPLELGFKETVESLGDDILKTPGVNPDAEAVVRNALEQIQASPASIPATRYHAWQSAWRKNATAAWRKGDAQLGEFYSNLAEAADEAAALALPARNISMQALARRYWGNYKALTRLQNTVNKQTGNVNARTFAKEVQRNRVQNRDLAAITDIAALPRFQNSGTADRLLSNQLLPGGLGAGIGAAVSDDPVEGAAIGAGVGFAGSRLLAELFQRGGLLPQSLLPSLGARVGAVAGSGQ